MSEDQGLTTLIFLLARPRRLKIDDIRDAIRDAWGLELATGLALVSSPYFRVAPRWYVALVAGILGGRANLLTFHVALGLLWIFVFLVYGIFGWRSYLAALRLAVELAQEKKK